MPSPPQDMPHDAQQSSLVNFFTMQQHSKGSLSAAARSPTSTPKGNLREVGVACFISWVHPPVLVQETVRVDLELKLTWIDDSLIGQSQQDVNWTTTWKPEIKFRNRRSPEEVESDHYFFACEGTKLAPQQPSADGRVHLFRKLSAEFFVPFHLHRFPCDRHLIEISIGTFRPTFEVLFVPHPTQTNGIFQHIRCTGWTVRADVLASTSPTIASV